MPRTSSRQAASKAKEAISRSSGGTKRKSVSKASGASRAKAQKTEKSPTETPAPPKEEVHQETPLETKTEPETIPTPEVTKEPEVQPKKETPKEEKQETKPEPEAPPKEEAPKPIGDLAKEAEATFQGEKDEPPSNVLEKGIIYFFFRGRVGVDEPDSLDQVARSFIVLRPLPLDSTLAGGALTDDKNCRLIMLPKKVFPTHPKQRYMAFVEKANVDVKTIRDSFAAEDHETKTRGIHHTPAATPYAEGVYAITHNKSTSHLAYVLTIPQHTTEVQKDFGLADRGSFIVASKNPKYPGPQSARLPKGPEYPSE